MPLESDDAPESSAAELSESWLAPEFSCEMPDCSWLTPEEVDDERVDPALDALLKPPTSASYWARSTGSAESAAVICGERPDAKFDRLVTPWVYELTPPD